MARPTPALTPARLARKIEASKRRAQVVEWKTQGLTLQQIGDKLGCTKQRVGEILREALNEVPAQKVHEYRALALEQNDLAIRKLLEIAEDESVSPRTRVEAWTSIRGFWERSDKLVGAYAPTRREVRVISEDTIDAEIERLTKEMEALESQQAAG